MAFPGGGLPLVVREGRIQRTAQCTGSSAGPKRHVHAERDPFGGGVGEQRGDGRHRALGGFLRGGPRLLVQEQQVDVARVVEFVAAQLPEADHRERVAAGSEIERLGDAGVGDRADLGDDLVERCASQVARGDAEHGPAPEPSQTVERTQPIHGVAQLGPERIRRPCLDVGEHRHLAGVRHQEVGGGGREPQQPRRDVGDLRPGELGARLRIVAHPGERHPRELGVGRRGERSTEHLGGQHPGIIASADPRQRRSEFTRA